MSIHPACVLICEDGHIIRRNTVAYRQYCDATTLADHAVYLEDPSLRDTGMYYGHCVCGNPLLPHMLPDGAHHSLIRILCVMEYPISSVQAITKKSIHMDAVRHALRISLHELDWFEPTIAILQACLNTAWKTGFKGFGMYLLSELYQHVSEKEYIVEVPAAQPPRQLRDWEGMSEEQVLRICTQEPPFSWDDVEISS